MNRIKVLRFGLYAVAAIVLGRLFLIQIVQNDKWVAKAEEQHTMENTIEARRGEIYMMDGDEPVVVVMNKKVYTIVMDPMIAEMEEIRQMFKMIPEEKLAVSFEEATEDKTRRYLVVAQNVARDDALKIKEVQPKGVWFKESTKRVYPEGELAARTLGFVNADGEGQYGVEGALNTELAGICGDGVHHKAAVA